MGRLLKGRFGARYSTATAVWTPDTLSADLDAWWSADDLSDGAVTDWADNVGALTPTQGTADNRPVRAATSFNSAYPGVTFDGTDYLRIDATTGLPSGATPSRIMVVAAPSLAAGANTFFAYGGTTSGLRRVQKATADEIIISDGTTTATSVAPNLWTSPGIACAVFDAAVYYAWMNGVLVATSGAATLNTSTTRTTIGASNANTPAGLWTGVIRHILIGTWSDAQQVQLEGWVAWNSGLQSLLPSAHAFKNGPP